jgi:hypothetical protein
VFSDLGARIVAAAHDALVLEPDVPPITLSQIDALLDATPCPDGVPTNDVHKQR